ncbi:single-stranded DNA-binding protein [Fulvivirga sediminis]|uniref:Single-stranded DNA-binding protein n=1 Tax=Fulvivirga sediminis TaxID=2803949 RepID=A0A937FC52_9BACT|nr:single-stranded DNA-binding protein [Fulvivirga sediminis]MBL3658084.1 single-stranded DNA-binding protein [Fulvivirga sediminis]
MKNLRNSVQLIGRLGKDPEVKSLTSGSTLATFTLATTESYKNASGDKVEETQWHNLVAWGKTADIASQYLKKGHEIAIEGKLVHRSYENAKGDKKYVTEINVNEILMLNKKR